jgi:hypothetical protein
MELRNLELNNVHAQRIGTSNFQQYFLKEKYHQ